MVVKLKFGNGWVISPATLNWVCDYLSMLGLKLIQFSKRGISSAMNLYRSIVHLSLFVCPLAVTPLQWRLNGCDGVSNHQPHHCLLNRLFRRRSKKTSKLCITGLCAGNSPLTGEFPAQMAGNAEMFLFDDVIMTLWGVLSRKLPELETNMHVLHTFQNPLTLMLSWLNLDDILSKPHSGGWFEKQIFPSNVLP